MSWANFPKENKTRQKIHGKADACRGFLMPYCGKILLGAYNSPWESALRLLFLTFCKQHRDGVGTIENSGKIGYNFFRKEPRRNGYAKW
jgi:hypothetical protein